VPSILYLIYLRNYILKMYLHSSLNWNLKFNVMSYGTYNEEIYDSFQLVFKNVYK
jgi:hypothetical protein